MANVIDVNEDPEKVASIDQDVDLGFLEKVDEAVELSSVFFPSKVGGNPAWLSWNKLPGADTLECKGCKEPLAFLCQVYAPKDEKTETYHRSIFVFCCRNGKCLKESTDSIKVFRDQLSKDNSFYPLNSPDSGDMQQALVTLSRLHLLQPLCSVCGCSSAKKCAQCHQANYCSKTHQVWDWKNGHKFCCKLEGMTPNRHSSSLAFPEYELVTEPEPQPIKNNDSKDAAKYQHLMNSDADRNIDSKLEKELLKLSENQSDPQFNRFKNRVAREPNQVLRYGDDPLWVSSERIPTKHDVPRCSCGSERKFEFQIMPQLLNYLNIDTSLDSLDWGTLAVYVCADNCDVGANGYAEEFVWKQDFSNANPLH